MKCKMCGGKSKYDYCQKCGLYLGETKSHLKEYIETIDGFVLCLNTKQKFDYYEILQSGHVYIKHIGFRKLVSFLDNNFDIGMQQSEIEAIIKLMSYICLYLNHNVIDVALKLFGMLSIHLPQYDRYARYWCKMGMKINNWNAYLYMTAIIDSGKHPKFIINRIYKSCIERKMRTLGKYSFYGNRS